VPPDQLERPGVVGVDERHVVAVTSATSPSRLPGRRGEVRTPPALVHGLVERADPSDVAWCATAAAWSWGHATGAGVQPPEPALARLVRDVGGDLGMEVDQVVAHVDLPVVGRDHERGIGRERGQHLGHQLVGGGQLGVVVVAQAVLMGDLVDAVVVRVDEGLARRELVAQLR